MAPYRKLGKYDVLEVIGRGGMGVIYKGVDPGIGRVVAIKMMTGGFAENPELLQRFYREAQSAGKLQHPNIVTIYDLGVQDGNPYLVMEFLEGESLEAVIRSRRLILLEDKLDVVVQVCEGVGYAHQRRIIHRDIKPANVMLLQDHRVKIVDFGIARIGNEGMTRPGQIMGSIQYMSPEQINGANVDTRSDIFSIGVLLYQLLTAALPFEGKDTGETLLKILHEAPPPLSRFLEAYPPELDEIVQRVLAKDREQRFQAAEDLALDLAHVQEGLRRDRAKEYLEAAEAARAAGQLNRAKEQLLQVLKIDRQDARASGLLREIQQEIQRQQRGEQARELQSEAEKALARGELGEALAYLDRAIELDQANPEIIQLRDSVRESKARSDKLRELLHQAEMAQDAGDLEEAHRVIEEAVVIDGKSTEVRSLYSAISREIAERDKQLKLQNYMGAARKQISSRHFTAALQLLKEAEAIDPEVPGIQELINLAVSGQQQERKRQDLERLTSAIEDALNRDDYENACAKAEEGLRSYPEDRGLKKLKAVADKQRAAREKRNYIEERISTAQKLLEERKPDAALACLQEALEKYPNELPLQSMLALVTETVERERLEQKKADSLQKAREAIRRREYKQAISLLEAARQEMQSSDFDDLLQFAEDEAANYEKRQRIDAVADQAHQLNSQEKYEEAIQLLEATLQEVPDQELEIILSDIRRHVEDFNRQVQEAIGNANRLVRQERYAEAVKFLEAHPLAKSPQLCTVLAEARQKQQFCRALCAAKEEVRDAISRSALDEAQTLWQKHRDHLGDILDIRLLEQEIEAKRRELANAKLETALRDARVLLLVRSFDSALRVLETASALAPNADPELMQQFNAFLEAARAGAAAQQAKVSSQELEKKRSVRDQELEATTAQVSLPSLESLETLDLADETQVAQPSHLEAILGEVTLVADHYRHDSKVQRAIDDIKSKITSRITALRQAELVQEHRDSAFPGISPEGGQSPPESTLPDVAGPWGGGAEPADIDFATDSSQSGVASRNPEAVTSVETPSLTEAPRSFTTVGEKQDTAAVESSPVVEASCAPPEKMQPQALAEQLPPGPVSVSSGPEASSEVAEIEGAPSARRFEDGSALEAALLKRLEEEERVATEEPVPPVAPRPPVPPVFTRPTAKAAPRTVPIPKPRVTAKPPLRARPQVPLWQNPAVLGACLLVLAVVVGITAYVLLSHSHQSPQQQIKAQQESAIKAADKLVAAGDLIGARKELDQVAGLGGPLSETIQERLQEILAAIKNENRQKEDQLWQLATAQVNDGKFASARNYFQQILNLGEGGTHKAEALQYLDQIIPLREKEEQLWQLATAQVNDGKFASARNSFQQILSLGEGGTRKADARQYLDQIPLREKEQGLFEQAQRESNQTNIAGLQHASGLLDKVIALNGPRKADATRLRATVSEQISNLQKQERDQNIATLQADALQRIRRGDFTGARQDGQQITALGGDAASLSAQIEQAEKPEIAFQQTQQQAEGALSSGDKTLLEASLGELQKVVQADGPHAKEASELSKQVSKKLAALRQPSDPGSVPRKTTLPMLTEDETAVRQALVRFNMAFQSGQPRKVKAIWPSVDKKYTDSMRAGSGYSFEMALDQPGDIQINGNSAMVPCQLVTTTSKPGREVTQSKKSVKVALYKTKSGWQILDPLTPNQ